MASRQWMAGTVCALLLAGCGGGGIGSTPTPQAGGGGSGGSGGTSTTPAPVNTLISDLQASQSFTSDATTTRAAIRTTGGIVNTTAPTRSAMQVSYDAATRSYTVTTEGRSQSFAPTDRRTDRAPGEINFAKLGGPNDYLTLVTTPYYGNGTGTGNRYVGLGYWQRSSVTDGVQAMDFSTFTYGLTTVAGAVPRTGSAHWTTDIFGLLTTPGQELRTVQGRGDFDVDFGNAIFSGTANLDQFDFITGGRQFGGGTQFWAGGQIGSDNGFSGNMGYDGGRVGTLAGTISGQFYGPGAEEVGASFQAKSANDGSTGSVFTGALTGQRTTPTGNVANLSLLNVQSSESLAGRYAGINSMTRPGVVGNYSAGGANGSAQITIAPGGPVTVSLDGDTYRVLGSDRVADGRANYTTYRGQVDNLIPGPVEVAFYRPGSANGEIALTYLSFATWTRSGAVNMFQYQATRTSRYHILYGIVTAPWLLAGRTGTGRYDGIVVASAAGYGGTTYDVGGTSRFDVDFSAARYTGTLALTGTAADGTRRDFGSFGFGNVLYNGLMRPASIDGALSGEITPNFYGPDGQEVGAAFRLTIGTLFDPTNIDIGGITVAKRR